MKTPETVGEITELSPLKRALIAIRDMQARLDAVENGQREPIAIVGMACRFPGHSQNVEAFWHLLRDGVDAITPIPRSRWDVETYYDPDPDAPGKMYTRGGGFIEQVDGFDAKFFAISPREAVRMDPQQRLLLEVGWEALENAGISPRGLVDSSTGVFVGISTSDYSQLQIKQNDPDQIDAYFGTGGTISIAAGRLSYFLGLQGPSIAIDTACSSSMVAVDLAIQYLRSRKCDLSLAGGVNLMLSPDTFIVLSKVRALSADGRCKTFDASADGYGRGEGCGMIVLKRLSDAKADGDNILAVIRGSAVNHDGRSSGLTVPNGLAQQEVIRQALVDARIEAGEVSYVEAHGTGTALGDPIELRALDAVFGKTRRDVQKLITGSVKTNIGHLEAAAGIGSLIKVILSLQHGEIPPHLHFKNPSPHIPWEDIRISIPTELTPWPKGEGLRVAGVSSFSFSGTNVHMIVQEAPLRERRFIEVERPVHLLTLSARSEGALTELGRRYLSRVGSNTSESVADVCFTANVGRSHFGHRLAVVGASLNQISERLRQFVAGHDSSGALRGNPSEIGQRTRTAFHFTGQGSQFVGMGRGLYETQPTFRRALEECDDLLRPHMEWPLISTLYPESGAEEKKEELLSETGFTQPALFSVEYALAMLWRSWGIEPSAVMGHGVGEYVAACIAGVFSLEDGLKLIAARGRLMQSPAFHSTLIEPILDEFERTAATIPYSKPRIKLISNLTGESVAADEIMQASWWRRHAREPVRFAESMQTLHRQGFRIFLEVGPHPVLLGMGAECLPGEGIAWLPSLRRGREDWQQMLESLGELYARGVGIDWAGFDRDYSRRKVVLPTYPFERERYWIPEAGLNRKVKKVPAVADGTQMHPLLGICVRSPLIQDTIFTSSVSADTLPFLKDHLVFGIPVFPMTGLLETALAGAHAASESKRYVLEDIAFEEPLFLHNEKAVTLQFILSQRTEGASTFRIYSTGGDEADRDSAWTLHAAGRIRFDEKAKAGSSNKDPGILEGLRVARANELYGESFYTQMGKHGVDLGPAFRIVEKVWRDTGEVIGRLHLPDSIVDEVGDYQIHPALLHGCFQLVEASLSTRESDSDADYTYLPVGIKRFDVRGSLGPVCWGHAHIHEEDGDRGVISADIRVLDDEGDVVVEIDGYVAKRVTPDALQKGGKGWGQDLLYDIQWEKKDHGPAANHRTEDSQKTWLIFADRTGIADSLATLLEKRREACVLVDAGERLEKSASGRWTVNPGRPEDFRALFQEIADNSEGEIRGVIHLWSLDAVSQEQVTPTSLEKSIALSSGTVLHLVQALDNAPGRKLSRLWLVTRGAQTVGTEAIPCVVSEAPLWGLGKVVALEHPETWGGLVDLDLAGSPDEVSMLLSEIWNPDGENHTAFRQGQRYVARLARIKTEEVLSEPLTLNPDCTYLITGGLGGLGIEIAHLMIERNARHLVLVGRSAPSRDTMEAINQLETFDAHVVVINGDVSQEQDVVRIMNNIRDSMPPLKGIVHAAGVIDDGTLLEQHWSRFVKVLAPKVNGAWFLHTLTQGMDLDFFVLFSSGVSLLGNSGQANYAAANAFLDSMAHHRRQRGLPALSIDWGAWSEVGMTMALEEPDKRRMVSRGMEFITRAQGLSILEEMMRRSLAGPNAMPPQIGVLRINWKEFRRSNPELSKLPLLSSILSEEVGPEDKQIEPDLTLEALLAAQSGQRRSLLEAYLIEQLGRVLRVPAESLDLQQPISTMGFDSLMAVELRNQIAKQLRVVIPAVMFLRGSSLSEISAMLLDQLEAAAAASGASSLTSHARALSGLKGDSNSDRWEEGEI